MFLPVGVRRQRQKAIVRKTEIAPVVFKYGASVPDDDGQQGVHVQQSQIPGTGLGLFAGSFFRTGERITEYCGTLMNTADAMMLLERQHVNSIPCCIVGEIGVPNAVVSKRATTTASNRSAQTSDCHSAPGTEHM